MIFDVHAHCVPAALIDDIDRHGSRMGVTIDRHDGKVTVGFDGRYRTAPLRSELIDTETRIETMDQAGVDVQVLASWIDLTGYQLERGAGLEWSRAVNDRLAEAAASRPGRFLALGTVPLQDGAASASELHRAMSELDLVGVEIATTIDHVPFHRAELDDFWSAAAQLDAFVLVHPMNPLPGADLGPYFMDNMVGRPAETTLAFASILFSGVLERHPRLTLCLVHGGGFVPFQIGRMNHGYRQKPALVAEHLRIEPIQYLRRNVYVDTIVHEPLVLRFLVELMGADRILLGTDYPFEMGDQHPTDFVRSAGLDDEATHAIVSANAERLFGARAT